MAKAKRRKAKRRKAKRKGVIRRAIGRWAGRQVKNWAQTQRARIRKVTKPKVVHASAKRRQWERQFPDPRRKPERVMEHMHEWLAEFEALLDNGWKVPFQVDIHNRQPIQEAAYEAAELQHGKIARTRSIVDVKPRNDLAEEIILEET